MDKVLEIGHFSAGFCGRLFAQNGADVVRIKRDPLPSWATSEAMDLYLHSEKKMVDCQDRDRIRELASKADLLVFEGTSADSVESWGIDQWDVPLKSIITPFGLTGPKKNWRSSSNVLLAMGGYTNCSGRPGQSTFVHTRTLRGIPSWPIRIHRCQCSKICRGTSDYRREYAGVCHGTKPVHYGPMVLRGSHSFSPWK